MRNVLFLGALAASISAAASITVPGNANPFLAGKTDGTACCSGDSAPAHSPAVVGGLILDAGGILTFQVSGWVNHTGGGDPGFGPDGGSFFSSGPWGTGMSGFNMPIDALVGVFLNDSEPVDPPPAFLDYASIGTDFSSFSPMLQQVFFIGDGQSSGTSQQFVIPVGATRLFLATSDGFGWFNNSGAFEVTINQVVPEPSTWFLGAGSTLLLLLARQRRKRRGLR